MSLDQRSKLNGTIVTYVALQLVDRYVNMQKSVEYIRPFIMQINILFFCAYIEQADGWKENGKTRRKKTQYTRNIQNGKPERNQKHINKTK